MVVTEDGTVATVTMAIEGHRQGVPHHTVVAGIILPGSFHPHHIEVGVGIIPLGVHHTSQGQEGTGPGHILLKGTTLVVVADKTSLPFGMLCLCVVKSEGLSLSEVLDA